MSRVVVMGASAGGVEALLALSRLLPMHFPAPICVVLHVQPDSRSFLPQLMSGGNRLPASHPEHGELLRAGHIYVAPPDRHLTLRGGHVQLGRGPRENGHRPAIDPLFRSAASSYGAGAIGVVLTGTLDDGSAGLVAIKAAGGTAIVQNPEDAAFPDMPRNALASAEVDHITTITNLSSLLLGLLRDGPNGIVLQPKQDATAIDEIGDEAQIAIGHSMGQRPDQFVNAKASVFACPDCAGVLWEVKEDKLVRYRCRVGHAYSPQTLSASQSDNIEEALWVALRALRENVELSMRLATRARSMSMPDLEQHYTDRAMQAEQRAELLEGLIQRGQIAAYDDRDDDGNTDADPAP